MLGPCRLRLRILMVLALLGRTSLCHASDLSLDSKAQGLAHYIMAFCHDINGESAQAISEYQASIKLNGLESAPRLKLGAYFLRLDETDQAELQLKEVTRRSPEESQAHYLLALIYSSQHQYDLAASEYEDILKSAAQNDSANTDIYMYLGQLYYAQLKYPQAVEQFLKIVDHDPTNTSALYLLGSVYADTKESDKAINIFRQVLKIDPQHSEALNSLGYLYAEKGVHLNEAIRMVHEAIEIDPSNGAFYDSLGWALYRQGRFAESLMALQKAESYIEDEILYDHMGDVFNALKQYTRACKYWRKSLSLDPHQILVEQKIKEVVRCFSKLR